MIDPLHYRTVLGHYPTGVCVVTAPQANGPSAGMVIGSFTSVSLDPPLVGFFPDRSSASWARIEQAGQFCVNVLADDQQWVCSRFASRVEDKFDGVPHHLSDSGLPRIENSVAWIECDLDAIHETGDHYLVLGRVRSLIAHPDRSPLLFHKGSYGQYSPGAIG